MLTLVFLCFFFSMLITNDVALISFVPFTFIVLRMLGTRLENRLLLPVVMLQTIGANLGSMLTPIGNPQNLYLYGRAGLSVGGFLLLMLPYTLWSLGMLVIFSMVQGRGCPQLAKMERTSAQGDFPDGKSAVYQLAIYLGLFLLCLLAVGRILPWQAFFSQLLL